MYGNKKPSLIISLDFLTPSKRGKNGKSRQYGDDEDEEMKESHERMSYAELARKRLEKKRKRTK